MTPLKLPLRYAEVTRVNSASRGSLFSLPLVSRSPRRWCSSKARRRRSRRSVRSSRCRIRSLDANSGCSARGCALPSTTVLSSSERSKSSSPCATKMLSRSRPSSGPAASRSRSGKVIRISRRGSPPSRSLRIRETLSTASGATAAGISTKIVRTSRLCSASPRRGRPLAAHPHQLEALEHQLVQRRRDGHAELLGQHPEDLGGAPEDFVDGAPRGRRDLALQPGPGALRHRAARQQLIDVEPVSAVGGNAPPRGVSVKEEALRLELAHRGPDRGRRDPQAGAVGHRLAAGRLGRLDVDLDHRREDPELAVADALTHLHEGKISDPSDWPPARRGEANPPA